MGGRSPSCVTFVLTNTEAEEAAAERSIVLILGQLPPGCLSLSHTAPPTTATEMGTHDQILFWGIGITTN